VHVLFFGVKSLGVVQERYLRDTLPVRLGGLAANLSRIKSFAAHEASRDALESLIDESKYFIKWTAADAEIQTAAELVALQIQLARWQCSWSRIWVDLEQRRRFAEESSVWSKRVLELSSLLRTSAAPV
jgi:hypothetical protein